jgi:hypothetical protein
MADLAQFLGNESKLNTNTMSTYESRNMGGIEYHPAYFARISLTQ